MKPVQPTNVVSITSRPRLTTGDTAEIVNARFAENVGKTVTIIRREPAPDDLPGDWFKVRANDERRFVTFDMVTGAKDRKTRKQMLMPADSLRKVWGTRP
jgi:hypothetical protein